jgi:hypothetical protein
MVIKMDWLFGDDEGARFDLPDYTTIEGLQTLPVADPFEKWSLAERDQNVCPSRLGFQDNRFRLLSESPLC